MSSTVSIVLLLLVLHSFGTAGQCTLPSYAANDTKTLKSWLLSTYDRWSVPNATIEVGTSMRLIDIYGVDTELDSYWMELQVSKGGLKNRPVL